MPELEKTAEQLKMETLDRLRRESARRSATDFHSIYRPLPYGSQYVEVDWTEYQLGLEAMAREDVRRKSWNAIVNTIPAARAELV